MNEFQVARQASVWVLPLETGGCGAALQSIYALLAPRYAAGLRARGVSFARSPRHADIVLIAGPLSQTAREPVRRLLETVPQPRALIAVGNCAIDGCVFAGSPDVTPSPTDDLDVNIEVSGCPPTPAAILAAIVEARRLLAGESVDEVEAEAAEEALEDEADGEEALEDEAPSDDEEGLAAEDDADGDQASETAETESEVAETAREDDKA